MRTQTLPYPPHPSVARSLQAACSGARRFTLPLVVALALGGCTGSYRWVKDGLSTSLGDAKYAACQLDAERALYSSSESEEARTARIRRQSQLCMKADGWTLARIDGTESSEQSGGQSSEPAPRPSGEVRLAQASEPAQTSSKAEDKPSTKVEVKKEVKLPEKADDSGGDDEEE